jgi:hypothetical protein
MKSISSRSLRLAGLASAALGLLSGCASTRVDAQWSDPQRQARSLKGEKVLVVCEAYEVVIRRLCQDELVAAVTARGGRVVVGPESTLTNPWRPTPAELLLPAARSAGASAVFSTSVVPGLATTKPGFSVGFGLGGFGGGGVGGGVGVSAPVGGGQVTSGYTADSQIADVASNKLLWTAKVSTDPSSNVPGQITDLSKAVVDAAQKAGLF